MISVEAALFLYAIFTPVATLSGLGGGYVFWLLTHKELERRRRRRHALIRERRDAAIVVETLNAASDHFAQQARRLNNAEVAAVLRKLEAMNNVDAVPEMMLQ